MNYFLDLDFFEKMLVKDKLFIAKVRDTNIFVLANFIENSQKEIECRKVIWYYNRTSEPSINDEIPFVDVLELVDKSVSQQLIFNMDIFNKRSLDVSR